MTRNACAIAGVLGIIAVIRLSLRFADRRIAHTGSRIPNPGSASPDGTTDVSTFPHRA